jgi:hypothetical protein
MVGFSRLFEPWSRIAWSMSRASFLVFHASLFASARMLVPLSRPSSSTRGNRSSIASPPAAAPFFPAAGPAAASICARSALVRVGSGGAVPSTLSNSAKMVVMSCGFRSSNRSLMPEGAVGRHFRIIKREELTRAGEQLDCHHCLGRACSRSRVRVLQRSLQELDEAAQRQPGDPKLRERRVDPRNRVREDFRRLELGQRVVRCAEISTRPSVSAQRRGAHRARARTAGTCARRSSRARRPRPA